MSDLMPNHLAPLDLVGFAMEEPVLIQAGTSIVQRLTKGGACRALGVGRREDAVAWGRTYEKLEKDTTDLFELIKKRIDADPFDALFGRHFRYPNRARTTWWGVGGSSEGPTTDAKPPGSRSKPGHATDLDRIKKQQAEGAPSSTSDSSYRHTGGYPSAGPSADNNFTEDSVIDPITMRKIPRKSSKRAMEKDVPSKTSTRTIDVPIMRFDEYTASGPSCQMSENVQAGDVPTKTADRTIDVPIERFDGYTKRDSSRQLSENEQVEPSNSTYSRCSDTSSSSAHEVRQRDWLTREGFGPKSEDDRMAKFPDRVTGAKISPRIESALDRRMRARSQGLDISKLSKSDLTYEAQENSTEDVDVLRASDIRAASGEASRKRRHLELRKKLDRIRLEADFEALQKTETIGLGWKEEVAASEKRLQAAKARKRDEANNARLETEISAQKAAMEALEMRQAGDSKTSSNMAGAHAEQGDGDVASNVHEFAGRERWYKRKAPHAVGAAEQEAFHFAKARSLIREIRSIYEEMYGVIDTKHRQPEAADRVVCGQKSDNSPTSHGRDAGAAPEEAKGIPRSSGPLSVQEKIETMLQQLLDDSRYMQKLLRTPELTSQLREELFHRNRSMQNASDAIAEALSNPAVPSQGSKKQAVGSDHHTVVADQQQQVTQPTLSSNEVKKPCNVYSVLAYDPSNQQVTAADITTSSESPSERRVSLSEALSSLTDPAKFLPQLTKLQSQGYEIVSSDTNILVLKKNCKTPPSNYPRPPPPSPSVADKKATAESKEGRRFVSTIEDKGTSPGNFASATSFVKHDSGSPSPFESENAEQTLSVHKVRRLEDVFSGPRRKTWHDNSFGDKNKRRSRFRRSSRRWRTSKRVLWVGSWTAACCYAVGVLTEFLRA
ncbi:MAG: hypothetical protein Q9186_002335 [Xanthomendoza sp. 1 TL-2023]